MLSGFTGALNAKQIKSQGRREAAHLEENVLCDILSCEYNVALVSVCCLLVMLNVTRTKRAFNSSNAEY